jgi:hypothetical protein
LTTVDLNISAVNYSFTKLNSLDYNVSINYDETCPSCLVVRFKFLRSFLDEVLRIKMFKPNNLLSVYSQILNNTEFPEYEIVIGTVLVQLDNVERQKRLEQMGSVIEVIQNSPIIRVIKELNLIDMLINSQAVTNLLLVNFHLSTESYEFARLLCTQTYPKMPSWTQLQHGKSSN